MATVKIEHWTYETGVYNKHTAHAYQAHIEDENGAWIEEAPARDDRNQANDDARRMRETLRERGR